jgi:UDP-glucuronate 4-epimerase
VSAPGSVLLTGGAGFIGSHLTEALLARGARRVVVLDNFDPFYDPAEKRRNLEAAASHPHFSCIEGDIRDLVLVERLLREERIDCVVHLAARAGVRPSLADPVGYADVNVTGTACVLEACRRAQVRRVIFGSSSSVYGNNRKVPFSEDDAVDDPISPYAATKRAGELLCRTWQGLHGGDVACLRFFTVFGPRQRPEMAIHAFARAIASGEEIELYGDGSSARDYTYVDDIVAGIVRAMERCRGFRIWNLGGSRTTTLSELVDKLGRGLGARPRVRMLAARPGDVERTWADIARARAELDWEPTTDLDAGIARFLTWLAPRLSQRSRAREAQ